MDKIKIDNEMKNKEAEFRVREQQLQQIISQSKRECEHLKVLLERSVSDSQNAIDGMRKLKR
jgi:hypothetical protein